jgi:hypothetical protein
MPGIWKWVLIKLICQKKTCTGEIYTTCIWFAKELGIGYDNFSCTVFDFKTVYGAGQTGG